MSKRLVLFLGSRFLIIFYRVMNNVNFFSQRMKSKLFSSPVDSNDPIASLQLIKRTKIQTHTRLFDEIFIYVNSALQQQYARRLFSLKTKIAKYRLNYIANFTLQLIGSFKSANVPIAAETSE